MFEHFLLLRQNIIPTIVVPRFSFILYKMSARIVVFVAVVRGDRM